MKIRSILAFLVLAATSAALGCADAGEAPLGPRDDTSATTATVTESPPASFEGEDEQPGWTPAKSSAYLLALP